MEYGEWESTVFCSMGTDIYRIKRFKVVAGCGERDTEKGGERSRVSAVTGGEHERDTEHGGERCRVSDLKGGT